MVPVDVIERIKGVEGSAVKNWEKRGVEVGAEAWAVLTEWKEARDAVTVDTEGDEEFEFELPEGLSMAEKIQVSPSSRKYERF